MGFLTGGAQVGMGVYNLVNKPKNPADEANKYISQIINIIQCSITT